MKDAIVGIYRGVTKPIIVEKPTKSDVFRSTPYLIENSISPCSRWPLPLHPELNCEVAVGDTVVGDFKVGVGRSWEYRTASSCLALATLTLSSRRHTCWSARVPHRTALAAVSRCGVILILPGTTICTDFRANGRLEGAGLAGDQALPCSPLDNTTSHSDECLAAR